MTTAAYETIHETASTERAYEILCPVSDEADELVIALEISERRKRTSGEALSIEESMRAFGLDPADFGLE